MSENDEEREWENCCQCQKCEGPVERAREREMEIQVVRERKREKCSERERSKVCVSLSKSSIHSSSTPR